MKEKRRGKEREPERQVSKNWQNQAANPPPHAAEQVPEAQIAQIAKCCSMLFNMEAFPGNEGAFFHCSFAQRAKVKLGFRLRLGVLE